MVGERERLSHTRRSPLSTYPIGVHLAPLSANSGNLLQSVVLLACVSTFGRWLTTNLRNHPVN